MINVHIHLLCENHTARTSVGVPEITVPQFQVEAATVTPLDMGQFSAADLERFVTYKFQD